MTALHPMIDAFQTFCRAHQDASKAAEMAAYLKTDMPFYGVPCSAWKDHVKTWKKTWPLPTFDDYRDRILALWALPHREEKALACWIAITFKQHITADALPLYQQLITEGAWWDIVDELAMHAVGAAFLRDRPAIQPTLEAWIDHDDLWLRRTALLAQLHHKAKTDPDLLFEFCRNRMHEKEFFIRKAIG